MFKKPVWDDLSFVTWCIILLELAIRRWVHCSHEGIDGLQQYSGRMWRLNNEKLVISVPRKYPLHHYSISIHPEPLSQGRMGPCFHVLYAKFWPYHPNVAAEIETHQTRQRFSNLLLSNFGEPVWILASVSCSRWQERHPVWSSAAVAHLLQGSMCCAFRDGILHTLVVTSGYLSYCCLSIISNLWHQQGIFVHTTAAHWIFSLFRTILRKP